MCGATGAIIAGAVVGAGASAYSARQGAKATGRAADASIAEQQRQFDLARADTAGQRALGDAAIARLSALYGYGSMPNPSAPSASGTPGVDQSSGFRINPNGSIGRVLTGGSGTDVQTPSTTGGTSSSPDMGVFFASPDYQFNLAQGQQAIERSAAARGGLVSGNTLTAATGYAQGLASREYSAFVDRLMQQAGIGATGIGASAAAGANAANNISNINMNAANARVSGINNMASGVNNTVQSGLSNYLMMQYLNKTPPGVMNAGGA